MTFFSLSIKNILHKPLNAVLSVLLFALGVGLISLLLLTNRQLSEKFDKNLAEIDLVIGAKGSPLQLILCSMYHIDAPTGNIKLSEVKPFLNPNHPLFSAAIPLSLGDSYKGYRIVGSNNNFSSLYAAKIKEGTLPQQPLEATIGIAVADALKLKIGDAFKSNHGLVNDGLDHEHAQDFKVVGIFEPTGAVIDQLITTPLESIWAVHEQHHDENQVEKTDNDHDEHEPMITSLLLKYKSRTNFQALNLPRNINENTNMQAASPAIELNRLYSMMSVGEKTLKILALIIVLVSGISVFIALFNALKERRYELSLLRVMGATPSKLFFLVIGEGILLALLGCLIGLALSHVGMGIISSQLEESYRYSFSGKNFLIEEFYLILASLLVGILAALIPAILAYKTDIVKNLIQ
jgi:putative ABC transport system permease protein